MRAVIAGDSTWARSVTKPSGRGMAGSSAGPGGSAPATRARARRLRMHAGNMSARELNMHAVDGGDDALHLFQIRSEVGAQGASGAARAAAAVVEQAAHHRQRP